MIGLLAKICLSVSLIPSSAAPATVVPFDVAELPDALRRLRCEVAGFDGSSTDAKYRRMNFADTVFPAPLMAWLSASGDLCLQPEY